MSRDNDHDSQDELIQNYLENEATPTEEKRFRLLLGEESFRRRVAEYAIDLGHICDHARQGVLERVLVRPRKPNRLRRVLAAAVLAASVLLAVGVAFVATRIDDVAPRELAEEGAGPQDPRQQQERAVFARVATVTGTVLAADGFASKDRRAVVEGMELRAGDALYTVGPRSFAVLRFADGSMLSIAGDTELSCSGMDSQKRIDLRGGDVFAQVAPQPPGQPMLIHTPKADAEVLGTKLTLFANAVATKLTVLEGQVRMKRLSDDSVIDVQGGHAATASTDVAFAAEPLSPVSGLWEEDFEKGIPADWELGKLAKDVPPDAKGAVRAVGPEGKQDYPKDQFFVASPRDWWRGLFHVEDDSHLNFTYKLEKMGWFNVMIETRSDDSQPEYSGAFVYGNPAMWTANLDQWRTVSVPLRFFRVPSKAKVKRGAPAVGDLVFRFYFSTQETDPGLIIDRIWITRGPHGEPAEVLQERK
jgi:FecR-like protein